MWNKWKLGAQEGKTLQVQSEYVTQKKPFLQYVTGNLSLRTLVANHTQPAHRGPVELVLEDSRF